MGKNSGGSRAGGGGGVSAAKVREVISKYPALSKIKDEGIRNALAEGIAEYEKEFGLELDNVRLYSSKSRVYASGGFGRVSINTAQMAKGIVGDRYVDLDKSYKRNVANGYHPKGTDKNPAKSIMMHELTHNMDRSRYALGAKNQSMSYEISQAYSSFKASYKNGDSSAKDLGRYALKNRHEYFAEGVSAYMSGLKNKHTIAAYNIAKKYWK